MEAAQIGTACGVGQDASFRPERPLLYRSVHDSLVV